MQLTDQQSKVYNLLKDFVMGKYKNPDHPKVFILDGFAGTGKSTVISLFLEDMKYYGKDYQVLTYTGKASEVLQSKGLSEARTIHSFLYNPLLKSNGEIEYVLKDPLDPYCLFDIVDFVVVDESSFVSDKIYEELEDNVRKIIYVGDSYQLSLDRTNKLDVPDISLTEPLRFALESPIGKLADDIRRANRLPFSYTYDNLINWCDASKYDIIVCYKNNTRMKLNLAYRKVVLNNTGYVSEGENIMFLSNSMDTQIYSDNSYHKIVNGLIITLDTKPMIIREYGGEGVIFKYKNILFYFGEKPKYVKLKDGNFFFLKYPDNSSILVHPVTYAYAITCHKAQGSEWNNVLLIKESSDPHYLYTGVTRARNNLKIVNNIV